MITLSSSVRSQGWRSHKRLALTAFAKEEDQQEATAAGFQRHLSKPVNPDDLIEVVASLASILR
ncbi:hypothetical protein [Scytonema sp. PCC 10023]|uniref:hypothetical protein n=1 Tax=Scytonema sp. PCC 10023 TaxID=1680591 RepID=UPI0039C6D7EE